MFCTTRALRIYLKPVYLEIGQDTFTQIIASGTNSQNVVVLIESLNALNVRNNDDSFPLIAEQCPQFSDSVRSMCEWRYYDIHLEIR